MTTATVYRASPIRRRRATKSEMEARRAALYDIVAEQQPMTVRQVFYQAVVRDLIEKTEGGYAKVQTTLVNMRRSGALPYGWIADNTRWMRKPRTFSGIREAVEQTAATYRKALWDETDAYVEIWMEKDALAGVIYPITGRYDVPLMVARGYSSLTFLHEAADVMECEDRPCFVYHLGDRDPSGVNAAETIERTLRELAPEAEIHFEQLAVLPEQIAQWDLPTRPTKTTDTRARNWTGDSVELDAIHPDHLRQLVLDAIERHLPEDEMQVLKAAEESERGLLKAWAATLETAA